MRACVVNSAEGTHITKCLEEDTGMALIITGWQTFPIETVKTFLSNKHQLNFRWNPRYSATRTYLTISYNLRIRKRVLFMCMGIDGLLGEENMKYWNTHFKNQSWGKPVLIEDFVEASKQVEHFLLILHEETATDGVLQHDSWRWNSATTRS